MFALSLLETDSELSLLSRVSELSFSDRSHLSFITHLVPSFQPCNRNKTNTRHTKRIATGACSMMKLKQRKHHPPKKVSEPGTPKRKKDNAVIDSDRSGNKRDSRYAVKRCVEASPLERE